MLSPSLHPITTRSNGQLRALFWTGLLLGTSLAITYGLWLSVQHSVERSRRAYFDIRVHELGDRISKRLEHYQQVLYGTRGLFAASRLVERSEFRQYVAALFLETRYPGVQGVGFSLIVPRDDRERHLAEIREHGFPGYEIYPDGERDTYTAIIYLEPFAGRNLRAFGYDMFSEPVRNQAMSWARDNDSISVSGKVTLVQETDQDVQPGYLMYLPVYRNELPHETLEQRRSNVIGWVYSPFRMNDLMKEVGREFESDLTFEIFDGDETDEEHRLFGQPRQYPNGSTLKYQQQLLIANRPWTLLIHAEPGLQSSLEHALPLVIAGAGTTLSALLASLLWEFMARGRALALAAERTQKLQESEARFRLMANSAPVLIWLAGTDKNAIWFNTMWLEFTGHTLARELGRGWMSGIHPEDLSLVDHCYDWHFEHRLPFSVEYRMRRHDGHYRWLTDRGVPRFDENGAFVGFIGSCVDITNHKVMEDELLELATIDSLTGFLNRRYFLVRLQDQFARVRRNPAQAVSLLMLDLDHFKRVNDTYGHAAGDALLKHFAEIVRSQLRKVDLVGRLGGEEFGIALPDTDLREAQVFAERLRLHVASTPLALNGQSIRFTVSIGIAALDATDAGPDAGLTVADQALYRAKHRGRNRIETGQRAAAPD